MRPSEIEVIIVHIFLIPPSGRTLWLFDYSLYCRHGENNLIPGACLWITELVCRAICWLCLLSLQFHVIDIERAVALLRAFLFSSSIFPSPSRQFSTFDMFNVHPIHKPQPAIAQHQSAGAHPSIGAYDRGNTFTSNSRWCACAPA